MTSPPNITNITPPRVPLVDSETGLISREWYRFLLNLFVLTGSGTSSATLKDLQVGPPVTDYAGQIDGVQYAAQTEPTTTDYAAEIARLRADLEIGTQPPVVPPQTSNYTTPASAITPTGSPFTYTNQTGYTVDVIVSGGGVSLLEFSRDGATFFSTGSFYGMFTLSPNDRLRVTYVAAPTMTLVPR
jgi:hypothetical protein